MHSGHQKPVSVLVGVGKWLVSVLAAACAVMAATAWAEGQLQTNYITNRYDPANFVPVDPHQPFGGGGGGGSSTTPDNSGYTLDPWSELDYPADRTSVSSGDQASLAEMQTAALAQFMDLMDTSVYWPHDYAGYTTSGALAGYANYTTVSNIGKGLVVCAVMYEKTKVSNPAAALQYRNHVATALAALVTYQSGNNNFGVPYTIVHLPDALHTAPYHEPGISAYRESNLVDGINLYADVLLTQKVFAGDPDIPGYCGTILSAYNAGLVNWRRADGYLYFRSIKNVGGTSEFPDAANNRMEFNNDNFFAYFICAMRGVLTTGQYTTKRNNDPKNPYYGYPFPRLQPWFQSTGNGILSAGTFFFKLPGLYLGQVPEYDDALANLCGVLLARTKYNDYTLWGTSPSGNPDSINLSDGYMGQGNVRPEVVAPHALAQALEAFPTLAARDLLRMRAKAIISVNTVNYAQSRVFDAYDVTNGKWVPRTTSWDLALYWMALTNYLDGGVIRNLFGSIAEINTFLTNTDATLNYLPDATRANQFNATLDDIFNRIRTLASEEVVENLNNDASTNDAGGQRDASWYLSHDCFATTVLSNQAGNPTPAVRVTYTNKPASQPAVCVCNLYNQPGRVDFTKDTRISFDIMTEDDSFAVTLKDTGYHETEQMVIPIYSPGAWVHVTLDFFDVNWKDCNPALLGEIDFIPKRKLAGNGVFYVDNIVLGKGDPAYGYPPHPARLLDDLENDHSLADAAGSADGEWATNRPDYIKLSAVTNAAGNASTFLKVRYDKTAIPAEQEDARIYLRNLDAAGNWKDFATSSLLSFSVLGVETLRISFMDAEGQESQAYDLAVNNPKVWSTVSWNYATINWASCDPNYVTQLIICPSPRNTAQGTFYLDDLVLNQDDPPTYDFYPKPVPAGMTYSTFLGGMGTDSVFTTCTDSAGNVYVAGQTDSDDLPVTLNAYDATYNGGKDAFVAKFSSTGNLLYCTYLGGQAEDAIRGMKVGADGHIYATGATWSTDFPRTNGSSLNYERDAFVVRLNPALSGSAQLVYGGYLGGSAWDYGFCIDVDNAGNAYVGGFTHGGSFPIHGVSGQTAAQPSFGGMGDGFLAKINTNTPAGVLVYSTFLGGEYWEAVSAVKVRDGRLYAVGGTQSPHFPLQNPLDNENSVPYANGGGDGFLTVLNADGTHFEFSTFYGTNQSPLDTAFEGLDLDAEGNVYLGGYTRETACETLGGPIQAAYGGGAFDGLFVKIAADFSEVLYATYLGGSGDDKIRDVKRDGDGNLWLVGNTDSNDWLPEGIQGGKDLFACYVDPYGRLYTSRRWGGSADDDSINDLLQAAVNFSNQTLCVGGATSSQDYPVTDTAAQRVLAGAAKEGYSTVWAKPTYTPYPVPTPSPNQLIENFENDLSPADQAGRRDGQWLGTGTNIYTLSMRRNGAGNAGNFLKVQYDKTTDPGAYLALINLRNAGNWCDFSVSNTFSFHFMGSDVIKIKFKDTLHWQESDEVRIPIASPNAWTKVTIDLNSVNWGTCSRATVGEILFFTHDGAAGTGTFYLDNFRLGDNPDPAAYTPIPAPNGMHYGTFLGETGDERINATYVDAAGNLFVAGDTTGGLTTLNAYQSAYQGGAKDGFIAKYNSAGVLQYRTYLGGDGEDVVRDIQTDAAGNIYVTGHTYSSNFPHTDGSALTGERDAFVVKLNPAGQTLLFGRYLGGSAWDYGFCLDVDNAGNAYIGGFTHGGTFPVTSGAAQFDFGGDGDGYIAKLNTNTPAGALVYCTYLGGRFWESVSAIKVKDGRVYATGGTQSPGDGSHPFPLHNPLDAVNAVPTENQGADGFLTVLSADGATFDFSTFIGPEQSPAETGFNGIELDAAGNVWLAGRTSESAFATTNGSTYAGGAYDGVLVQVAANFSGILYSALLGGSGEDHVWDVKKEAGGNLWLLGQTTSANWPAGSTAFGGRDLYVMRLDSAGSPFWPCRFGGSDDDAGDPVHGGVSPATNEYCFGGGTRSANFPVTANAAQEFMGGGTQDAYLAAFGQPASGSAAASSPGRPRSKTITPPTPTPTPTPTPVLTSTPTSTPTVTPTPTPVEYGKFLDGRKILTYPNPARGQVKIVYAMPEPGQVTIEVYQISGERVARLQEFPTPVAGAGQSVWSAEGIAPGIYILRVTVKNHAGAVVMSSSRKLALVK